MLRVQGNDPEAFSVLYDRLAARAFHVAYELLDGDAQRAEHALHDAFLAIWRGRGRYEPTRGPVHSWVIAIVRSRAGQMLRR